MFSYVVCSDDEYRMHSLHLLVFFGFFFCNIFHFLTFTCFPRICLYAEMDGVRCSCVLCAYLPENVFTDVIELSTESKHKNGHKCTEPDVISYFISSFSTSTGARQEINSKQKTSKYRTKKVLNKLIAFGIRLIAINCLAMAWRKWCVTNLFYTGIDFVVFASCFQFE